MCIDTHIQYVNVPHLYQLSLKAGLRVMAHFLDPEVDCVTLSVPRGKNDCVSVLYYIAA